MFLAPVEKKSAVRAAVANAARAKTLAEFREIPVKFVESGAEVLYNGDQGNSILA